MERLFIVDPGYKLFPLQSNFFFFKNFFLPPLSNLISTPAMSLSRKSYHNHSEQSIRAVEPILKLSLLIFPIKKIEHFTQATVGIQALKAFAQPHQCFRDVLGNLKSWHNCRETKTD